MSRDSGPGGAHEYLSHQRNVRHPKGLWWHGVIYFLELKQLPDTRSQQALEFPHFLQAAIPDQVLFACAGPLS
jgi:hypothetical protein